MKAILDKNVYNQVHIENAKAFLLQQNLKSFQYENDPNHTVKKVKQQIPGKIWPDTVLVWHAQSSDLNRMENLRFI